MAVPSLGKSGTAITTTTTLPIPQTTHACARLLFHRRRRNISSVQTWINGVRFPLTRGPMSPKLQVPEQGAVKSNGVTIDPRHPHMHWKSEAKPIYICMHADAGTVAPFSDEINGSFMYIPRSEPPERSFGVARSDPRKWPARALLGPRTTGHFFTRKQNGPPSTLKPSGNNTSSSSNDDNKSINRYCNNSYCWKVS